MPNLIVIRILPQAAVTPDTFATYLSPSGLGDLTITAYDLSFNNTTTGQSVGTAAYIPPTAGPSPTSPISRPANPPPVFTLTPAIYAAGTGIVQQIDLQPAAISVSTIESPYYTFESVATAVIQIPSPPPGQTNFENLRLVAQWGTGAAAQAIAIPSNYYDVALVSGAMPADPNEWAALAPSLYLTLPPPPTTANPLSLQLSSDGAPPAFQDLLAAVRKVLDGDPGGSVTVSTAATATAASGTTTLLFPAGAAGIANGMSVSGPAGAIPAGATVAPGGVATGATGVSVTLSQQLSATVNGGTAITFTPDLGALTLDQCKNIAYEIVWSQQPPPPSPPDPVEDLYTNPPNNGALLNGATPNQSEGDRQQFEAELNSYYTVANATADRLTNFVFALSAAIACQQQSLAATQVLIELPSNPGAGSSNDVAVVLTGLGPAAASTNFGVPAAYFYALGAAMPSRVTVPQRYSLATRDTLTDLLGNLTAAINAGIVTDSEGFTASVLGGTAPAGSVNAAQVARRLVALYVPAGAATPLAPLDSIALATSADAPSGNTLTFASVAGVNTGMSVGGPNIPPGATVSAVAAATGSVTLSAPLLNDVPAGTGVIFTPPYSIMPGSLTSLIQSWLNFPLTPNGAISSVSYQPGDDDTKFWPGAAAAQPAAFLNLVLCALTQGAMLPAPFTGALGDAITTKLLPSATVAALAAVTGPQWTQFFQANPTWLPSFTRPGDTTARIAAFIRAVQKFFPVGSGGLSSPFVLATSAPTPSGQLSSNVLHFPPTNVIAIGMSVSGPATIPAGATVTQVATSATSTDVTLSQAVTGLGVAAPVNVTFSLVVAGAAGAGPPALPGLAEDWLAAGLSAYGAYTLGDGFNLAQLQAAAAQVFADDPATQAWLVDALIILDALYKIVQTAPPPAWIPAADAAAYTFSVIEALYARGFASAGRITELSAAEFQQALAGTVAYNSAVAIYASASVIAPPAAPESAVGGFQPVNPDGALTNCIPPPCSSPVGPVTYLSELLKLSPISTCEAPVAMSLSLPTNGDTPSGATLPFLATAGVIKGMLVSGTNSIPSGATVASVTSSSVTLSAPLSGDVPNTTPITFTAPTLASALSGRRGPLGDLAASCANLETPLPLIDIDNECLEYMASQVISATGPAYGQVYDTSADALAGHLLCEHEPCPDETKPGCHNPARLFAALPEYSTPASPIVANTTVEPLVWNTLKSDFSTCRLPYSQALDVSRSYLRRLGSCRFEEMRTFRKCITEFVLSPASEPQGFADYLWRYPVRIDIAREYLGVTPEEYALLFAGTPAPLCVKPVDPEPPAAPAALATEAPWQLYGFASAGDNNTSWIATVVKLPEFLARTCLGYCEFYELWQSGFVRFVNSDDGAGGAFPQCEPCCLDALSLSFPDERTPEQSLAQLAVFIRLWRKLKECCCLCLSFAELRDVCDVLQLFSGNAPSGEFVRQLAAFQMLREQFQLELYDPRDRPVQGAIDADRTQILALWVGPTAKKWGWAIRELCDKVVLFARRRGGCEHRAGDFAAALASHLDVLSKLAGFDPASTTDNWHALPTHTLRLAEILAKVAESRFQIRELIYLFTAADDPGDGGPFPLQEELEAQELPLGLPDDEAEFSLWRLRRELLAAADDFAPDGARGREISFAVDQSRRSDPAADSERRPQDIEVEVEVERIAEDWDWRRVASFLEDELGFASADVLALAQHFFPHVLERAGHPVDPAAPRFISSLPVGQTTPAMWTGRAGSPFQYDATAGGGQLCARIPIPDAELIAQLTTLQALNSNEQAAVQDLYFQPRAMLARFALLFPDFPDAQKRLIELLPEGESRWRYFRRHVALCHRRCHIIAAHFTRHVAAATRRESPEGHRTAMLVLKTLLGDENKATANWENDDGAAPPVTWGSPNGGAFAALLGLVGTGLTTEYKLEDGTLVWRDVSSALDGFGAVRDQDNAPLPTVLPSMAAALPGSESAFLAIRNGFLVRPNDGDLIGGAQGFDVTWSGALLIEEEGDYEFWAGAPTPRGEKPNLEKTERCRWRVALKRGSRTWVILSHQWPGEEERLIGSRLLRRGAYEITAEFVRPEPDFSSADRVHRVHAGFEIKYRGPDSRGERVALPRRRLFAIDKDEPLGAGVTVPGARSRCLSGDALSEHASRHPPHRPARVQGAVLRQRSWSMRPERRRGRLGARLHAPERGQFRGRRLLPQRRRLHAASRRFRLQLFADRRPLLCAGFRSAHHAVRAADSGDVRLVGAPVRLHRGARRRPPQA